MTDRLEDVVLTRPTTGRPGPLDERLYDLVEARFRRIVRDNPIVGTYVGIHTEDARLGDGSRDAVLDGARRGEGPPRGGRGDRRRPACRRSARFERDLEIHNLRRAIFDIEVARIWERRSTALDAIGDGLFLIFAQDFAPLPERLESIAGRLEEVPAYLEQSEDAGDRPPGPALAAARDRVGRRPAVVPRRDRRRGRRTCRTPSGGA